MLADENLQRDKASFLVGAEVETLTPEEEAHFRQYRSLPEEARRELEEFILYLRQRHGGGKKSSGSGR